MPCGITVCSTLPAHPRWPKRLSIRFLPFRPSQPFLTAFLAAFARCAAPHGVSVSAGESTLVLQQPRCTCNSPVVHVPPPPRAL